MQYLKIQRFRLANRGCLCWDVFSRSTWPSSLCWSFWSVPHLSTMWSSSRSRPAHRSRSRGLCSQRTSTPSWRRWAVVVTASCARSNWLHLSVCSSVVPGQAAGLQGESGWFALLCWAPGGERRLWAALWQDRQETGLPVRWELVNVLGSQKDCRTHWKCFLMTNCRNSCRILKVESRLRPSGLFLEVIFGYVTAFAPSYEVFAASRLLVGLMNGGIGVVCFVLVQEYVGKSYWAMTGTNLEVHNLIQSQFSLFSEVGGIWSSLQGHWPVCFLPLASLCSLLWATWSDRGGIWPLPPTLLVSSSSCCLCKYQLYGNFV